MSGGPNKSGGLKNVSKKNKWEEEDAYFRPESNYFE